MIDIKKITKTIKDGCEEFSYLLAEELKYASSRPLEERLSNGFLESEMRHIDNSIGKLEDFLAQRVIEAIKSDYKEERPMDKNDAIFFAGEMEDFLNIPALVCELIEKKLTEGKYEEVIRYIVERKKKMNKEKDIS